jgi:hypothetical protein
MKGPGVGEPAALQWTYQTGLQAYMYGRSPACHHDMMALMPFQPVLPYGCIHAPPSAPFSMASPSCLTPFRPLPSTPQVSLLNAWRCPVGAPVEVSDNTFQLIVLVG